MSNDYSTCFKEITKITFDFFNEYNISADDEKEMIIKQIRSNLLNDIGKEIDIELYERNIYFKAIDYNDSLITKALNKEMSTDEGISICLISKKMIAACKEKNWNVHKLKNDNIDQCIVKFQDINQSNSLLSKIKSEDDQISQLLNISIDDITSNTCNSILVLLDNLEADIELANKSKIKLENVNNTDFKNKKKYVNKLSKQIIKRDELRNSLTTVVTKINEKCNNGIIIQNCNQIIDLCNQYSKLLDEYEQCGFTTNKKEFHSINKTKRLYEQYLDMLKLDQYIAEKKINMSFKKEYETFLDKIAIQKDNINTCLANKQRLPNLLNKNLDEILKDVRYKKQKEEHDRRIKQSILKFLALAIFVLGIVSFSIYSYLKDKEKLPFSSSEVIGKDYTEVENELKESGFTNIHTEEDTTGYLESDIVTSVKIDDDKNFKEGTYVSTDEDIVIYYSSSDRKDISNIVQGWKKIKYFTLESMLKNSGINNVYCQGLFNNNKDDLNSIISIKVNDEEYTSGTCSIPKNAPIIIYYNSIKITIGNEPSYFTVNKKNHYKEVVQQLEGMGFSNITVKRNNECWNHAIYHQNKLGSIASISIDGNKKFNADDEFDFDSEIIIIVNTNDSSNPEITEKA